MAALLESGEMYLETIYVLNQKSSHVRAIDIGEHMGYSKPSVSRALGLLLESGHILRDADGYITLTKTGEAKAKSIYERHTVLTELLINIGVDKKTAAEIKCAVFFILKSKTLPISPSQGVRQWRWALSNNIPGNCGYRNP